MYRPVRVRDLYVGATIQTDMGDSKVTYCGKGFVIMKTEKGRNYRAWLVQVENGSFGHCHPEDELSIRSAD